MLLKFFGRVVVVVVVCCDTYLFLSEEVKQPVQRGHEMRIMKEELSHSSFVLASTHQPQRFETVCVTSDQSRSY